MALHPDWKAILRKAWSVKFMLLAGAMSAGEVFMQIMEPAQAPLLPKGLFAALSGMLTAGALVARVLAQNEAQANTDVKP